MGMFVWEGEIIAFILGMFDRLVDVWDGSITACITTFGGLLRLDVLF